MTGRTRTEEVLVTEPKNGGASVKTLAIRLPDELHARLVIVAQLDNLTITDAIRTAIDAYIEERTSQESFAEQAAVVLEDIEREAAARRAAIQALMGAVSEPADEASGKTRPRTRRSPSA